MCNWLKSNTPIISDMAVQYWCAVYDLKLNGKGSSGCGLHGYTLVSFLIGCYNIAFCFVSSGCIFPCVFCFLFLCITCKLQDFFFFNYLFVYYYFEPCHAT